MSNRQKVLYSPLELKILDNIPKDGRRISTVDLANLCYDIGKKPRNARNSILDSANKLIAKSDDNQEEWEIFKSTHRGSQPIYFWREERKLEKKNVESSLG